MRNLKTVHENISGVSNSLPMLRALKIESMPNLEWWSTVRANDVQIFPGLQLLKVYDCPKLKFVPFLPACSKCIINASTKALMLEHQNNSPWDMPTSELSCLFLHGTCTGLQHFKFLISLSVLGCTNLSSWQENIISIASLQKLELCQSEIPEWLHQLSSLRELHLIKCKEPLNLSQFVKAPHQIALTIEDCRDALAKVPHEVILDMIRQVTTVQIIGCEPIMHAEWRSGELFKCKLRKSSEWYMKPADAGSLPDVLGTWQEEPMEFRSGYITNPDQPGPSGTK